MEIRPIADFYRERLSYREAELQQAWQELSKWRKWQKQAQASLAEIVARLQAVREKLGDRPDLLKDLEVAQNMLALLDTSQRVPHGREVDVQRTIDDYAARHGVNPKHVSISFVGNEVTLAVETAAGPMAQETLTMDGTG